jgi:hypothetical protein
MVLKIELGWDLMTYTIYPNDRTRKCALFKFESDPLWTSIVEVYVPSPFEDDGYMFIGNKNIRTTVSGVLNWAACEYK